jgi:hypothetical protein
MPITPAPPNMATLVADLYARLVSLVAVAMAHQEIHPAAYTTPSGVLMRQATLEEWHRLQWHPLPPPESTQ